ncbi:MAG: UDP-N-acetylglucosamine 2-epimerase (non-hydrolyzing), partial [Patescibacteria group bacterium]
VGTRPEIIKMAPVVRACEKEGVPFFILHSGQHYSQNMDRAFFEELELPQPKYNLGIGNQPHRKQVGMMVKGMTEIFKKENPAAVVLQGDTTTVLAAALAANKLGIKIAHHEAGIRSNDTRMIEETNRVATDHISDFLFTPTKISFNNLIEEGYRAEKINHVGNTIVDAILEHKAMSDSRSNILRLLSVDYKKYFLITAHRPENVDDKHKLEELLRVLEMLKSKYGDYKLVFPLHPRTRKMLDAFQMSLPPEIIITEPLSYFDFIKLEANAQLIITDSGGIQEESCVLRVPCVIIRENTERPEAVELGMNILSGLNASSVDFAVKQLLTKEINWENPFGDGKAAERIVQILKLKLYPNKYEYRFA